MSLRTEYRVSRGETVDNKVNFQLENSDLIIDIYVLTENMMRVHFNHGETKKTWMLAPNDDEMDFTGTDATKLNFGPKVDFVVEEEKGITTIVTTLLKAEINMSDFHITWYYNIGGQWKLIAKDRYTQAYNFEAELGPNQKHYLTRYPEEKYYGLGEKTGNLERSNRHFKMNSVDPMGYDPEFTDPLYKMIPFYITKRNDCNFGLFYDSISKSEFDLGKEYDNYHGKYRYFETVEQNLDYYIFVNLEIKETVEQFTKMTGKTLFMPKWSLGYSGSTMTYTDAPNAQEQLNEFIEKCEEHDVPCTSFQLSSGYTSIGDKRYVFNWNHDKFPDIKGFTNYYRSKGIELCANIKPALLITHPKFQECVDKDLFIKNVNGEVEYAQFWDELGAYLDFTNKDAINWWQDNVQTQLLEYGIMSTWNDNNEYEIWSEKAMVKGFGNETNFEYTRAIQPLLMMKASYERQREFTPNERPYVISRSGCTGMQRYAQTWTGDNRSDWKTLKYNIKTGLGLSLSGIYNIGHDVGGFAGDAPSEELFVRWVQNGIFHPRFTIHSWNDDRTVNVPWLYPTSTERIVKLLKFREYLTPYLYNLMYNATENAIPLITPTFYHYENDENTFVENDDFMLGHEILVTSVVNEGEETRAVYLPQNKKGWYEFKTMKYYEDNQNVEIDFNLDELNFFVEAGSVLWTNPAENGFNTKLEERNLEYYPLNADGETEFSFFEDDGKSVVKDGSYAKVEGKIKQTGNLIEIEIAKQGNYILTFDEIGIKINADLDYEIKVNDEQIDNLTKIKI